MTADAPRSWLRPFPRGAVLPGGPQAPERPWRPPITAASLALGLSLVAIVAGWRGGDLPAQIYRMDLVRAHGFVLWDNQWFAGHPTLDYSVVAPLLGAMIGPLPLAALSGVAAAVLFDRIVTRTFGAAARVGSAWFAAATVTNLVVGRVTFALGVAIALGAVLALQHRHATAAALLAALSSLASPLAGLFLATAAGGVFVARREERGQAALVGAAALAPILAAAAAFPGSGTFPYEPWAYARDLAICALVAAVAWRRSPVVAWACAGYAAVATAAFILGTPVGGNVSRLAQYVAGPLLACLLLPGRRRLVAVVAVPLLFWQWFPAVDGIAFAAADPSTQQSYYQPLLAHLQSQPSVGRLEIPPTLRHWETAYVAPTFALARGWERQTDIGNNPPFYDGTLTAASYQEWLTSNAVEYVALPDAPLDSSAQVEKAILDSRPAYLQPVWSGEHWKVWRVTGYRGLIDGPAQLIAQSATGFTLAVSGAADITVRIHTSPHWALDGQGCADATPDGWTIIRGARPGALSVTQSLGGTPCPRPDG